MSDDRWETNKKELSTASLDNLPQIETVKLENRLESKSLSLALDFDLAMRDSRIQAYLDRKGFTPKDKALFGVLLKKFTVTMSKT